MTFSAFAVFDPPGWQRRVKPSCHPSMPLARVQSLLDITCCKASKHTVVASMPSPCRCCHQRLSELRHQRRNVLAVTRMPTNVPCGKSLQRQLGTSSRRLEPVPRLSQASLVQICHKSPDKNSTTPSPAAVHPIGWIHGLHSASRAVTPRTPIGPRASDLERRRYCQ